MNRILRRERGNRFGPGSRAAREARGGNTCPACGGHSRPTRYWSVVPASTPAFLGELWDGIVTLRQIAEETGDLVVLSDENANHAFTACRLLCLRLAELPPACRYHLGQLLFFWPTASAWKLRWAGFRLGRNCQTH